MGYFLRVLGTSDPDIHLDELMAALKSEGLDAKLAMLENERADKWTLIEVNNTNLELLAQIERNVVKPGESGYDELEEFKKEIKDCKPASAAKWLNDYLESIKVIYAIQLDRTALEDENFSIVTAIRTAIWNTTGGILQSDGEGFTNEDGYLILWQFADGVVGDWYCSVLGPDGQWQYFSMNLEDPRQVEEFQQGKVPANATRS